MTTVDYLSILARIDAAYRHYQGQGVGEDLYSGGDRSDQARLRWVDRQAPFALLGHDGGDDPRFIYVNATACRVFEYAREEMIGMPSRLSAAADARQGRSDDIGKVHEQGFIGGYAGTRVTSNGCLFPIERGELWLFADEQGRNDCVAARVWTPARQDETASI